MRMDYRRAPAIVTSWTSSSASTIDPATFLFLHWRLCTAGGLSRVSPTRAARADGSGAGESGQRGAMGPNHPAARACADSISMALSGRAGQVRRARHGSHRADRLHTIRLTLAVGPVLCGA